MKFARTASAMSDVKRDNGFRITGSAYLGNGSGVVVADKQNRMVNLWQEAPGGDQRITFTAYLWVNTNIQFENISASSIIEVVIGYPPDDDRLHALWQKGGVAIAATGGYTQAEMKTHAAAHQPLADVPDWRATGSGLEVYINEGKYIDASGDEAKWYGGSTNAAATTLATRQAALTSGQHQLVWITFNLTSGILVTEAAAAVTAVGTLPSRSEFLPAAYTVATTHRKLIPVYLYYGQTAIEEVDVLRKWDMRFPIMSGEDGTVTSVALTATPTGIFDVSGSPITGSGTLALSLDTQSEKTFLAGPTSGAAATPAFRAIASADLTTALTTPPAIGGTTPSTGAFTTISGTSITASVAVTVDRSSGDANLGVSSVSGTARQFVFYTSLSPRWTLQCNSSAESGSNAGSNLTLTRFSDAGSGIDSPLAIVRSTGQLFMGPDTALTSTVQDQVVIRHNTSGTPAAGYGSGIRYELETSTTTNTQAGRVITLWATATHASRAARMTLNVNDASAEREGLRIEASGSAAMIGFLGASAVVRQTCGADLTNNVTSGGTDNTIANFTDLTTYANDAATIRNDIYQLARSVKIIQDALRDYGLLT